tara:strand:+ start:54 stop:524 length:471 start_codon:yes stop_codon:yes gene_type:complete
MTKDIISNCLLCGEHGLHLIGEGKEQMQQCLNCGYMSNEHLNGKKDNLFFKEMGETIKKWAKYTGDRIWIPVQLTLPIGALYPVDIKGDMKWAFVRIIDITEDEQKKSDKDMLTDESTLYNKKFDEENPEIFDTFLNGFARMNDLLKKMSAEESDG